MKALMILIAIVVTNTTLANDSVALSQLGKLTATFAPIDEVERFDGGEFVATATSLPGAPMQLVAPIEPQQVRYYFVDGEPVTKGQRVAALAGSEIHHFRENLTAKQALMRMAKDRYEANKSLVANNAISQSAWQGIVQAYYDASLAWEHLRHFSDIFEKADDPDKGFLISPLDGYFLLPGARTTMSDMALGAVLPVNAMKLRALVPVSRAPLITQLRTNHCQVSVERQEGVANQLSVALWSGPLPKACGLRPGQQVRTTAILERNAMSVPVNSVFYLNGMTSVLVRRSERLVVEQVEVIGQSSRDTLIVAGSEALRGQQVLTSSVSAVQGMLTGLGGHE